MKHEIMNLRVDIEELINYVHLKIKQRDWHGVSDAANDIREIEAKISVLKALQEKEAVKNDAKN
jgi:hypothetical protein